MAENQETQDKATAQAVDLNTMVSTNSGHTCLKCGKTKLGIDLDTVSIQNKYCFCDYSDSIQNYEHVLSELIRCAETAEQRENLELLVILFKTDLKERVV